MAPDTKISQIQTPLSPVVAVLGHLVSCGHFSFYSANFARPYYIQYYHTIVYSDYSCNFQIKTVLYCLANNKQPLCLP